MKKGLFVFLLIFILLFSASACKATTEPVGKNTVLRSIDISFLSAPENTEIYVAENWQTTEEQLCKALLKDQSAERTLWAPGPSYMSEFPSGEVKECLNFKDGGKEFSGKSAGWIGFYYSYTESEESKESFDIIESLTGYLLNEGKEILYSYAVQEDLSSQSIQDVMEEVEAIFKEIGLPATELSFAETFNADSLNRLIENSDLESDAYHFSEDEGCYLLYYSQIVNETTMGWGNNKTYPYYFGDAEEVLQNSGSGSVRVIATNNGDMLIETSRFSQPKETLGECDILSAEEAFCSVEKVCTEEKYFISDKKELVDAYFCYNAIYNTKGFVYRLQPCWRFTIKVENTLEVEDEEITTVEYIDFNVSADTGEIVEYDEALQQS